MSRFEELEEQACIRNRLDGENREQTAPKEKHFLQIEHWLYRIGNSRFPDQYETMIQVLGMPLAGKAKGAYIEFHRETGMARPPGYKKENSTL